VQVTTKKLRGKEKKAFLRLKKNYDESVELHLNNQTPFHKLPPFQNISYIHLMEKKDG